MKLMLHAAFFIVGVGAACTGTSDTSEDYQTPSHSGGGGGTRDGGRDGSTPEDTQATDGSGDTFADAADDQSYEDTSDPAEASKPDSPLIDSALIDSPLIDSPLIDSPVDSLPVVPPTTLDPCPNADVCWDAGSLVSACGTATVHEDFSTGKYNLHQYQLTAPAGVTIEVTAVREAGDWSPALLLHDEHGTTIHDGEHSLSDGSMTLESVSSGRASGTATVRVTAQQTRQLLLSLTAWHIVDGAFVPTMPVDAEYTLLDTADCEPPGGLLSPPNFDPTNVVDGFFVLPESDPPGLYERKVEACSRGTKLLIDVLYTMAYRWHELRPSLSPISIRDLNEDSSCSTADHETHETGIDADIVVECATHTSCDDDQPAVDLARLFVDTGAACGLLYNDTAVQDIINPYFGSLYTYEPWHGTFMRSYSGHTGHFHIRVMNPEGTCN